METGAGVPGYSGGAERLTERLFGMRPDAKKRIRSRVLRDVAWGPIVETGAGVPGYSAALPPAWLFRVWVYCSRGSLTPVGAPNASPNVFLAWAGCEEADSQPLS